MRRRVERGEQNQRKSQGKRIWKQNQMELKVQLAAYFEAPSSVGKRMFVRQFGMPQISMIRMVFMQGRYISPLVWVLSLFLFGMTVCFVANVEPAFAKIVYAGIPFLVMLSVTECTRSYRYGMEELEMTARFSLKSIMLARMVLLGLGNLAVLFTIYLLLGNPGQGSGMQILVPYFLTAGGSLCIVRKLRGMESMILCFGLAGLVSALSMYLPWRYQNLFAPKYAGFWILICGFGILFTVWESYRIIRMAEEM